MQPGDLIADRFVIERAAGSGGMGIVYRAADRMTGRPVALKMLHAHRAAQTDRFTREALVLAELRHSGIVQYVAHGVASSGALYLVMEWLEGIDLAERIARGPMPVDESILVIRQAAEALRAAHGRGIVHRDIKPSNLFLVGGRVDCVRIVDFGVARLSDGASASTQTGLVVGTPGYMAPEQARGERTVDARADVFSLGCVLFECLTGRPAFVGAHVMALLAKILLEDAPRVRSIRPEVPSSVDALTERMLAKDPAARPADAAALLDQIGRLGASSTLVPVPSSRTTQTSLTKREQRLLCVIAMGAASRLEAAFAATVTAEDEANLVDKARAALARFGARVEPIADGSMIAILRGSGSATDLVAQAARCALAARGIIPDVPMALATGRGVEGERWPVGEAIDRAVKILRGAEAAITRAQGVSPVIHLDDVTAGLLDARFDVRGGEGGLVLEREGDVGESVRTLLGRETPCVGREVELRTLDAVLAECVAERLARGVLVAGASGMGKSRLRYEFLRRVSDQRATFGAPQVWSGRGDPMSGSSPFALLAQAIRGEAGLRDGEPLGVRQAKLRARVARHVPAEHVALVTDFLGEIAGAPFSDAERVHLRAARQDPLLMADQIRSAWLTFVRAECAAAPVILVLEDLHWGDLPTVRLVDDTLRDFQEEPLMVLAFARPEVEQRFPKLWTGRGITHLHLAEISRRAAERLVRHVLGADVAETTLARLVEQAAGNALYLEELIRAVAEGKGDSLPDTVLAMVQARLEALEPDARRVLRAASIFGPLFWRGGLDALLGDGAVDLAPWLRALVERELVTLHATPKFPGEQQYAFRHDVVREASYAMLVDSDRETGHRLAAEWLEAAGERDAMVIAEHSERGTDLARAASFYRRAAEQALEANDLAAAIARAERGVTCGATGELLAGLRLVEAEAHGWRGEIADAETSALAAMHDAERGGAVWCRAAAQLAIASGKRGHHDRLFELGRDLAAVCDAESPPLLAVGAAALVAQWLIHVAQYDLAQRLLARLGALSPKVSDPVVAVRVYQARAVQASREGDFGRAVELNEKSSALLEELGNQRKVCNARARLGYAYAEIGDDDSGERTLRDAALGARKMGIPTTEAFALQNLGFVLARRGKLDEARATEQAALDAFRRHGDRRMEGACRFYLAMIERAAGDLASAETHARASVETLEAVPPVRCYALAVLAGILLARGRRDEALEVALSAKQLLDDLGGAGEGEALVNVTLADVLRALGDRRATDVIVRAAERVEQRALRITDRRWREAFLQNVPENARTLELAAAIGVRGAR